MGDLRPPSTLEVVPRQNFWPHRAFTNPSGAFGGFGPWKAGGRPGQAHGN